MLAIVRAKGVIFVNIDCGRYTLLAGNVAGTFRVP